MKAKPCTSKVKAKTKVKSYAKKKSSMTLIQKGIEMEKAKKMAKEMEEAVMKAIVYNSIKKK